LARLRFRAPMISVVAQNSMFFDNTPTFMTSVLFSM
jgi:hypothetical protein